MKAFNLNKILTLAVLVLIVNTAWSIEPIVKVTGNKKFVVTLPNVPENAQLTLKDMDGVEIYTETILKSESKFEKLYNMENLPDGKYQISLDGKFKTVAFPITVKSEKIDLNSMQKNEVHKPIFTDIDNKVLLVKKNHDKTPVHITVYNNFDDVLFEETLKDKSEVKQIYNFSALQGKFKILFENESNTYIHSLLIK